MKVSAIMRFRTELESNGVVNLAYTPHSTDVADNLRPQLEEDHIDLPHPSSRPELTDRVQFSQNEPGKEDLSRPPKKEVQKERHGEDVADGGYGWIVALAAALIMMLINVVGPCFSIIFSPFLLDIGTSSTTVGWIFNTFQFIYNFSGPLLGPLLAEFSWRSVAVPSTLIVAASLILSAFATSAEFLIFSYSVVGGISCGLLNNLCYLIVPHYFNTRRGTANAILVAGVSCGPILGPLLVTYLQENFGFKWGTLITGAVLLNACVGASLFRPLRKDSEDSKHDRNLCRLILRVVCSTVTNLSVLKSPRAAIIAVSGALTLNSWLNFLTLMPFAVQAAGYSFQDAAWCVTASAVCNLIASLGISVLSDCSFFNMRISCMVSTAIIAASTLAFSFIDDLTLLIVVMGVWGLGVGGYMGTYNLVIVKYMGIDQLIPTFGVTLMLVGLCFITIGPTIGLIRDLSQSYAVSMYVLSGMAFACSVLWNFMPAAVRYDQRKENGNNSGN